MCVYVVTGYAASASAGANSSVVGLFLWVLPILPQLARVVELIISL